METEPSTKVHIMEMPTQEQLERFIEGMMSAEARTIYFDIEKGVFVDVEL